MNAVIISSANAEIYEFWKKYYWSRVGQVEKIFINYETCSSQMSMHDWFIMPILQKELNYFGWFLFQNKILIYLFIFKEQTFISPSSGVGKFKIKVLADSQSGEGPFLVYRWAPSLCALTWCKRVRELSGNLFL